MRRKQHRTGFQKVLFATNFFFLSQPRTSFNSNYEDETIYREIDPPSSKLGG